jgi:hypothetical protein
MSYGSWPFNNMGTIHQRIHLADGSEIVSSDSVWLKRGGLSRDGSNTPGYFQSRKKGQKYRSLPMNYLSTVRWLENQLVGDITQTFKSDPSVKVFDTGCIGAIWGGMPSLPPSFSENEKRAVYNKAVAKVLDKIQDLKVNVLQVFAERKLTADMIAQTAIRIAGAAAMVKGGNLKGAAKYLGTSVSSPQNIKFRKIRKQTPRECLANGWLELQYGWSPLLQDVYGSAELVAQANLRELRTKAAAGDFRGRDWSDSGELTPQAGRDYALKNRVYYKVNFVLYYSTDNLPLSTLGSAGVTNPALLAWEVLPYSFVVDWFLPVGQYIQSLGATVGYAFEKGTAAYTERRSSSASLVYDHWDYFDVWVDGHGTANIEREEYLRQELNSFPAVQFPAIKSPYSFTHAANAAALLSQLFKR